MSAIVLHVEIELSPGKREDYVARARAHRDNVLKNEPGCLRFDLSIPEGSENTVRLYEVYADEVAFRHHMETDYMKAYLADTGDWITRRDRVQATLSND